jgi:hypothetical protein
MDSSTPSLLKGEINTTQEQQHDLAKWKLAATAVLGAAAFGLSGEKQAPNYWLLFFVPFVCAYVDLYDYQYRLRVLVIARFLREQTTDTDLKAYEDACEALRRKRSRDFDLGKWAGIGSSIGASIFGPFFYFYNRHRNPAPDTLLVSPKAAICMWSVGVLLIVLLYFNYLLKEKRIADHTKRKGKPATADQLELHQAPAGITQAH